MLESVVKNITVTFVINRIFQIKLQDRVYPDIRGYYFKGKYINEVKYDFKKNLTFVEAVGELVEIG